MSAVKKFVYQFTLMLILTASSSICLADAVKIFKENHKAVVTIYTYDKHGFKAGQGSGFLVNDNGLIVTNRHVIDSGKFIKVSIEKKLLKCRLNYAGKNVDVAILRVNYKFKGLSTVKIGDPSKINIGDKVYVIGSPMGMEHSLSEGIVSSIRFLRNRKQKYIQFTASISPGSSGSPVFSDNGEVIGITTLTINGLFGETQNLNMAIPINLIKAGLPKGD